MAKWVLIGPNGEREQIVTRGSRTPAADGANPNDWEEIPVTAHTKDIEGEELDRATRRFKPDEERIRARRRRHAERWVARWPEEVIDILAEAVAAKLAEQDKGPRDA